MSSNEKVEAMRGRLAKVSLLSNIGIQAIEAITKERIMGLLAERKERERGAEGLGREV